MIGRIVIVVAGLLLAGMVQTASAQVLRVSIIDRQFNESTYVYTVPATATTTTDGTARCGGSYIVNCTATETTTTVATAPVRGSYSVQGAVLSLRLPDNRIVVVNCGAKLNWTEIGGGNFRSCRVPPGNEIQVEFKGNKAKLLWPVSLDGKKLQHETYNIVAIEAQ